MTKPQKPWRCAMCTALDTPTAPRSSSRSRFCTWCAEDLARRGLQWCSCCATAKPPEAFTRPTQCRACDAARSKAWRDRHPGYTRMKNQAYQATHAAEMAAYRAMYYQQHRAAILAQKQRYYRQHRARIVERVRQYRRAGRISVASRQKMRERHRRMYHVYTANAKQARARRFVMRLRGAA